MMLSTSPQLLDCHDIPCASAISCSGNFVVTSLDSKSGLRQIRPLLKHTVLQLEEESTDIGSSISSDVDAPYSSSFSSPSCTDEEGCVDVYGKNDGSCWLKHKQPRTVAVRLQLSKKAGNFRATPLEPILGTPAGMSEHPPLLFASESFAESMHTTESTHATRSQATTPKAFQVLTGPPSPQRSRKPKGQSVLATALKLASTRRNRKSKGLAAQSVLATAPEHLVSPSHVLPPSPSRRARIAILDKAKRDEAPLKVQMGTNMNRDVVSKLLDTTRPVKKRPILPDSGQGFQHLKPGMPVKKRVTPWLLEEPVHVFSAMPR